MVYVVLVVCLSVPKDMNLFNSLPSEGLLPCTGSENKCIEGSRDERPDGYPAGYVGLGNVHSSG